MGRQGQVMQIKGPVERTRSSSKISIFLLVMHCGEFSVPNARAEENDTLHASSRDNGNETVKKLSESWRRGLSKRSLALHHFRSH